MPAAVAIATARLLLCPQRPEDADEMAAVLGHPSLHRFIGGRPATAPELRARLRRLAAGAPQPGEAWLNWTCRRRGDRRAVGTVQATLALRGESFTAEVAWVVGAEWQGRGYASEAARALVAWLRRRDAAGVRACIHPGHAASQAVARRAGLRATGEVRAGEEVWSLRGPG